MNKRVKQIGGGHRCVQLITLASQENSDMQEGRRELWDYITPLSREQK